MTGKYANAFISHSLFEKNKKNIIAIIPIIQILLLGSRNIYNGVVDVKISYSVFNIFLVIMSN